MKTIIFGLLIIAGLVFIYFYASYYGVAKEGSGCVEDSKRANEFCSKLNYEECRYYTINSLPDNVIKVLGKQHCTWDTDKNICYARIGCL